MHASTRKYARRRAAMPIAAVVMASCEVATHPPDLAKLCPRTIVETYVADENECITLVDTNGATLFRYDTADSCGGPNCIELEPGQGAYALEKLRPGEPAEWSVWRGSCAEAPRCAP